MDNKDFKFLCINTKSLWEEGKIENLEVRDEGISLKKEYTYTYTQSYKPIGQPVGFALDQCGIIFILDANGKILYFDPNTKYSEYIECIKFDIPKAIAVNPSNIYVIDGNKLKVLAKVNYQLRWEREDVGDVKAIAVDTNGVVYLLEDNTIYKLDRDGELSEFIKDLGEPLNVVIDKDDFIYILDKSGKILKFSSSGENVGGLVLLERPEEIEYFGLAVDIHKNFYIGIGSEEPAIFFIRKEERFVNSATYISKFLDSNEEGCQWHKFILDCEIPENTKIDVWYHISDKVDDEESWSEALINPKDALILSTKGRYIKFKFELSSADRLNTPKIKSIRVYFPRLSYLRYLPAVYQEDKTSREFLERFLSLFETYFWQLEKKIEEVPQYFDTKATPDEFLDWLSSWLGISLDGNWSDKKQRELLNRAHELFKKRSTREGLKEMIKLYLEEPKLVKFLKEQISKCQNGTSAENLEGFEHIGKDTEEPIIVEQFQLKPAENSENWKTWERLFGNCPYSFCVLLRPFSVNDENELSTVRRIVEQEKPAYTKGCVVLLQPWIYLDMHTYLGINTILSEPKFILEKDSVISRNTILADREKSGQIDLRARVGMDTILT